jgi:hypothetical protein
MEYVFGLLYAILMGAGGGWFFYNVCVGSKKDRLSAGILWSVGVAIISVLAAFGG